MKLDEALTFDDVLIRPGYSSFYQEMLVLKLIFQRNKNKYSSCFCSYGHCN